MKNENPKPIILSADDDENAHTLLTMAFTRARIDADIMTVNDGEEAICYLSGEGKFANRKTYPLPNLLLLDLKMPRVTGFGVLEYIRKENHLQPFPVIVFSSSDDEVDVKKAHALGCHAYVVKPTNFDKLLEFANAISAEFFNAAMNKSHNELARFNVPSPKSISPAIPQAMNKPKTAADSPELFKLLVEQVKDYAIFMLDRNGIVLSWNEGARRILGYEDGEIIEKHFSVFYPEQDKENKKPAFELRKAIELGRYEEEGWRARKDGSRLWANVIVNPLHDEKGNLIGFTQVVRDSTQRKLQEENLQAVLDSEEKFRLLVDQVKDYAIFVLDAKGNISSWNQGARRLKGYTADEVMGKHFSIFYTFEDITRDHPTKELSIAIREGRYEEEGWRVRKDGSRFWANVVITALWDKRGNLTGFAKVTRDLTQRKQQEDMLRSKTQELESFAHTLSHDLRAPLRAISSFGQVLRTTAGVSEDEKNLYADKIVKSANVMEDLIKDVLRLSQLTATPVTEEAVSLEDIFTESLAMLETEIERTKAHIEIRKPLPTIRTSRVLLMQIFSNLLGNALKFAQKGQRPKVEVFVTKTSNHCEIHVRDFGIGIPKKYQETVFKAFNRGMADSTTSGTGVGLAIVKKAVERIGGTVALQSEEGKGSDFVVTLACEMPSPPLVQV